MLKWPQWRANGRELTRKESAFDETARLTCRVDLSVEFFIFIVVYAFLLRLSLPRVLRLMVTGSRLLIRQGVPVTNPCAWNRK